MARCVALPIPSTMVQRYNSLMALRHYNGIYLLANKISFIFQYKTGNCLTAYLNEFTLTGEYTGQPLSPGFFNDNGGLAPGVQAY